MTLGELIEFLSQQDPEQSIEYGFGTSHSYRGCYTDLAFTPVKYTTVDDMLYWAKQSVGRLFKGYKGGEYFMDEFTDVYLADWGCDGELITEALLCHILEIPYSFSLWEDAE